MSDIPADLGVYSTVVAARLCGVHPQTLRTWDRAGLVVPARTSGGTRLYSANDVKRIQSVAELAQMGISIRGITIILLLRDEVATTRSITEDSSGNR